MGPIEIVACTDHRFIMPTGVMMYSVCKNNTDLEVCFHVIVDESVTEEDKEDLKDAAEGHIVNFYSVDSHAFSLLPLLGNIPHATYYRLLIPQVLPEGIHKVLFMDGDIIVRHSLLPLWETDIDEYALAAVPDPCESVIGVYNRLKYPPDFGYFNAGVLLLNLKFWRTRSVSSEIELFIKDHIDRILYCDQDVLNYVLREKKKTLPLKYNVQSGFLWVLEKVGYDFWKYEQEVLEARRDPVILHYTLGKPWFVGSYHPYRSTFLKYQNETKWKGQVWDKSKGPQRPFWVKVLSHSYDFFERLLIKVKLIKEPLTPKDTKFFLDLPPID